MLKRRISAIIIVAAFMGRGDVLSAQRKNKRKIKEIKQIEALQEINATPRLVVGIVVDQMRYDYLTRFWNHYGEGGFKRLVNGGFNCKNNHYNYAPTSTGPGHTSVYTGTTPATHGVIGNVWYDKELGQNVYCAGDEKYTSVGTDGSAGKMSPHRMLVTTVTDQLRLHTQMRGKVIAVALKDRGAVLPGGHTANAAYWFVGGKEGNWITSSYYMDKLPKWVNNFNSSNASEKYKKPWTTLKDIDVYLESGADNNNYEGKYRNQETATFPHNLPELWDSNGRFETIKPTPYGNSLTVDFALAALDGENLGQDAITDFLAVSFSSTDYVGHKFGVGSKEIQDTYLRLDRDLERLFGVLDEKVGVGEYTVFLTADHGAIEVPAYLEDQKIPAGYVSFKKVGKELNEWAKLRFGSGDLIKNMSNNQIFLDHKVLNNLELDIKDVQEAFARELLRFKEIGKTYTAYQMWQDQYTEGLPYILQNGYNQKRSGDVLFTLNNNFIRYAKTGSTHGSAEIYDTHVPLLFYGKGVKKGSTTERTEISDAAVTISSLLGIAFPSGAIGQPVSAAIAK